MSFDSYIKPQRLAGRVGVVLYCMSFDSYIKPQHVFDIGYIQCVVCLLIPTSNHNRHQVNPDAVLVVCLLIPTSNHNERIRALSFL